jgi:hypothetical protein
LRQSIAVVRVFVGDQDSVKTIKGFFDGGKPRQRFAFAEAGIYKEAGAFGLEQRQVARTPGRQNGHAQADRFPQPNELGLSNDMPNVKRQQA